MYISTDEIYQGTRVTNIDFFEDGLDVTYRSGVNQMYLNYPPTIFPDEVWKDIYRIQDGKLIKINTIKGVHRPAEWIPEAVEFPNSP